MHAATHGHVECIALMVAQGVDVDAQNVVCVVWCAVCGVMWCGVYGVCVNGAWYGVVWCGNYIT